MSRLSVKLARETLPLLQDARRSYVIEHPTSSPSDSAAIAHAIQLVDRFKREGGTILWTPLMSSNFDFSRFALPYTFPADIRFVTSIDRSIIPALDRFADSELSPAFNVKIYRNFTIRAALRAGFALTHKQKFRDVLMGKDLPSDPKIVDARCS